MPTYLKEVLEQERSRLEGCIRGAQSANIKLFAGCALFWANNGANVPIVAIK
ncbi:hypothetical protein KDAU_00530 [Dictyobacter aurantiacus]|uniref:Uncharacterized protein n=1 Tax=Dictyobacter aurantiacus TaxID=1936993 RepID=A0A401Z7A6_9CHLR|nr:hypothetical protein KDAU_00530 [Dictyobacter aurantiacus]